MTRYRSNHPAGALHRESSLSAVWQGAAIAAVLLMAAALVFVIARIAGHIA